MRDALIDLDLLTSLLAEVIESLGGVVPDERRQAESQALLEKMLYHALSIRFLYNRPITLPLKTPGLTVYDFPSGIVLSRALVETYLTLHELFLAPKTPDDFNFDYFLWRIRGLLPLEGFDSLDPENDGKYAEYMRSLAACREGLKATQRFQALKTKQQRKAEQRGIDDSPRNYKAAGVGPDTFKRYYASSSGYVHTDGQAANQIRCAKNHADQREMFGMAFQMVILCLARTIIEFQERYPECKAACNSAPHGKHKAELFSRLASEIDDEDLREKVRQKLRGKEGHAL